MFEIQMFKRQIAIHTLESAKKSAVKLGQQRQSRQQQLIVQWCHLKSEIWIASLPSP